MNNRLYLYTPKLTDLWYRKKILNDPDTMSYNKGYALGFDGYNNETGCINFSEDKWADWNKLFVNNEPERFYAYIVREEDGNYIGEVNLHKSQQGEWYDMGVVIESKYRGNGYSVQALKLLLHQDFDVLGENEVHNDFENTRTAAIKAHLSAGFIITKEDNGITYLEITKEQYNGSNETQSGAH